jgi:hypothetical protein
MMIRPSHGLLIAWVGCVGLAACSGGGGGGGGGSTYTISGTITAAGGAAAPGVTVSVAPGGQVVTTDSSGTYSVSGIGNGTYTLTPSMPHYTFAPASLAVTVSGASQSGKDFTRGSSEWGFAVWGQDSWHQ